MVSRIERHTVVSLVCYAETNETGDAQADFEINLFRRKQDGKISFYSRAVILSPYLVRRLSSIISMRDKNDGRVENVNEKYWKAVVRYGHVGLGKEVSVARFLSTGPEASILDVYTLVENMPGVKVRGVCSLVGITRDAYQSGKVSECTNAYLHKLMTHKRKFLQKGKTAA